MFAGRNTLARTRITYELECNFLNKEIENSRMRASKKEESWKEIEYVYHILTMREQRNERKYSTLDRKNASYLLI